MKALVTGASSGIGKDIAIYLDSLGYDLVLVARSEDKLKEICKNLKSAEYYICDLSKEKSVLHFMRNIKMQILIFSK